jgi:hypothetical protein
VSTTTDGNVSDHSTSSKKAYAYDLSNGDSPTPEMDKTALQIAKRFDIPWSGSGLVSKTLPGGVFRVQLIYRTMEGGNHFNHVHFGVRRIK